MQIAEEILKAYRDHDREITIRKTRVGCVLGLILFPVFNVLDRFVYPNDAGQFLILRLAVSAGMAVLYPLFGTRIGRKYHQLHGLILLTLPSADGLAPDSVIRMMITSTRDWII